MVAPGQSEQNQGQNAWLVAEMRGRWEKDRTSVGPEWQSLFADDGLAPAAVDPGTTANNTTAANTTATNGGAASTGSPASGAIAALATNGATAPLSAAPTPSPAPAASAPAPSSATSSPSAPVSDPAPSSEPAPETPAATETPAAPAPLRGSAARIVSNMEASLTVPTATSFREVPARLLEVNRSIINGYLGRSRGGKVSYTHLIAWAVVRAIADTMPAMNASYVPDEDGKPRVQRHEHVGLGIAIDVQKSDGSRNLLVPCIKDADTLSFREFVDYYNDLVQRARDGKLTMDDFMGTTVSITNPGTIGTVQSVPRLMEGQGLIVGVGAIAYPTEYQAADPRTLAELAVSKIVTISSTYDHRIIQGAESGLFLKKVHELLVGHDEFYDGAFRSIGVPYAPAEFNRDGLGPSGDISAGDKQARVNALVHMHRVRGHLIANLDPLQLKEPQLHSELDPFTYGLTIWDLDREFFLRSMTGSPLPDNPDPMPLKDILGRMRDAYARTIGVEYMHLQDLAEKQWISERVESLHDDLDISEKKHILDRLSAADALEQFLNTKYPGQKRFGIEGAESTIPLLDAVLGAAADESINSTIIGMAHRGRLNVLVNIVGKSHAKLFEEFEGSVEQGAIQGSGDVKYHLGQHGIFTSFAGNQITVDLAANPSHLEAVNPVVEGMVRARMDRLSQQGEFEGWPVLPVLIHGDAAFAGQGVVAETLNLSGIEGYRTGGTVHLVINNQVGFTTTPEVARSSTYPTDVARMVEAPILHVNGDDPEACVRVAKLAVAYRERFAKDIVIDMWCYRRQGHNEGDDPSYTQPLMYRRIDEQVPVRQQYLDRLVDRGDITAEDAELATAAFRQRLQGALDATRDSAPPDGIMAAAPPEPIGVLPQVGTAADRATIDKVYRALTAIPEGFEPHPKLARQFERRHTLFESGQVDWALAEAIAFGSLLDAGVSIRLSGQDSRRGTFSHRHSTLVDHRNGDEFTPLQELARNGTDLWIYDSLLSEYAVLGFEYGYSVERPDVLTIWEAQFGDFMNGAQIVIDQFIVSAEDKWGQHSGLVMLLPHGMEGQGPEHSSARMERFLLAAAEDNIQVANASTASQYFHLLRRQMMRAVRKPLILFAPKSLLRARAAHSPIEQLIAGTFEEVIDDTNISDPTSVTRVVLCTGKISHEAIAERNERSNESVAIVRVEQIYPWPFDSVSMALHRYPKATELIWLQEEPENMGAWNFVKGRLYEAHGDTHSIRRLSRPESGSPATGSTKIHAQEQALLLDRVFAD